MITDRESPPTSGRVYGWLSGLGLFVAPWIVGGIISTFLPEPEAGFPVVLFVALIGMIGWLFYGARRIPGFRHGAIRGALTAVGVAIVLLALLIRASP